VTETKTNPHADQQRRLNKAVRDWQDSIDAMDGDDAADVLTDCLINEGLQVVPAVPSDTQFRVLVDEQPAPTGVLDADEAVLHFLLAVRAAEETVEPVNVTVRPATDREMVGMVMGDRSVHNPPVDIEPTAFAVLLMEPGYRNLNLTDGSGQPVGLRLTRDMADGLAHALADEVRTWDGDEDDDFEDDE